ncbi:MAG: transposase [Gammaproteobacteria bacterium]|nr:transposase [Gammaproteobacteria bacterium]
MKTDTTSTLLPWKRGCSAGALQACMGEMYFRGICTRKVTAVLEKCLGLSASSTQVSRAAKLLDEELTAWRERRLGRICVQQELQRHTRIGSLFCNEESLLRLGSAVPIELDTRWLTQRKRYITWEDTTRDGLKQISRKDVA